MRFRCVAFTVNRRNPTWCGRFRADTSFQNIVDSVREGPIVSFGQDIPQTGFHSRQNNNALIIKLAVDYGAVRKENFRCRIDTSINDKYKLYKCIHLRYLSSISFKRIAHSPSTSFTHAFMCMNERFSFRNCNCDLIGNCSQYEHYLSLLLFTCVVFIASGITLNYYRSIFSSTWREKNRKNKRCKIK